MAVTGDTNPSPHQASGCADVGGFGLGPVGHHVDAHGELSRIPLHDSVGFVLSRLGFATARRFAHLLSAVELEPRHYALLRVIEQSQGQAQQVLGDSLNIPASSMVSLVDYLEGRGLVERRPHPTDRRARALYLTPAATELVERASVMAASYEESLCAGLSPQERGHLLSMLHKVGQNLGSHPEVTTVGDHVDHDRG